MRIFKIFSGTDFCPSNLVFPLKKPETVFQMENTMLEQRSVRNQFNGNVLKHIIFKISWFWTWNPPQNSWIRACCIVTSCYYFTSGHIFWHDERLWSTEGVSHDHVHWTLHYWITDWGLSHVLYRSENSWWVTEQTKWTSIYRYLILCQIRYRVLAYADFLVPFLLPSTTSLYRQTR